MRWSTGVPILNRRQHLNFYGLFTLCEYLHITRTIIYIYLYYSVNSDANFYLFILPLSSDAFFAMILIYFLFHVAI